VECQTERKQRAVRPWEPGGELAASSKPISVGPVQGIGSGVGTKFRVLTRGGLWASAHER